MNAHSVFCVCSQCGRGPDTPFPPDSEMTLVSVPLAQCDCCGRLSDTSSGPTCVLCVRLQLLADWILLPAPVGGWQQSASDSVTHSRGR